MRLSCVASSADSAVLCCVTIFPLSCMLRTKPITTLRGKVVSYARYAYNLVAFLSPQISAALLRITHARYFSRNVPHGSRAMVEMYQKYFRLELSGALHVGNRNYI